MKTIIFIIGIGIAFVSCNKNSNSNAPQFYIKATINDTAYSFDANALGIVSKDFITVSGHGSGLDSLKVIEVQMYTNETGANLIPVIVGSYNDTSGTYIGNIVYKIPVQVYYQAPLTPITIDSTNVIICNLTSMDSTTLRGTFSGKVYLSDGTAFKTITNGSFYVPIEL
jgi:hypothetical protein